jgi:hypothetical protein
MFHLSAERLAALADEEPTAAEALHLSGCSVCSGQRKSQQSVVASARSLGIHPQQKLTNWESLREDLLAEGLIVQSPGGTSGGAWRRRLGLVAAGMALLAGGAAAGRVSAGGSVLPAVARSAASITPDSGQAQQFASRPEALVAYFRAQAELQRAAAFIAASDENMSAEDVAFARLASLEEISSAALAGLRQAPTDPVLNEYYTSALSAREATMRQLGQFVPVSARKAY